jgi:hypothetical protein
MGSMKAISPEDQPYSVPTRDAGLLWGAPGYRMREEWEWEWRGILILARKNYEFDGASVPRIFWGLVGYTPDGMHRAAALAHDIGCEREGQLIKGVAIGRPEYSAVLLGDSTVKIKQADSAGFLTSPQVHWMFREFLNAASGSREGKGKTMWAGVRAFGPRFHHYPVYNPVLIP